MNTTNHGIAFKDAVTVFDDLSRYEESDGNHSADEERFKTIGAAMINNTPTIITLVYTMRNNDTIIRIITAWKSTKEEREKWQEEEGS